MKRKRNIKNIATVAILVAFALLILPIGLAEIIDSEPGQTYNVYATAKGKPGKTITVVAFGEFEDALHGSRLFQLGDYDISWDKGKPQKLNINELFYVDVAICTEAIGGICTQTTVYNRYWVFDIPELQEYSWNPDVNTIKGLQLTTTTCTIDPSGAASDYCTWENGMPITSNTKIIPA